MPDNVKCVDCGLLAMRHVQSRQIYETEEDIRRGSGIPHLNDNRGPVYEEWPICIAGEIYFKEAIGSSEGIAARRKAILNEKRNCESFVCWRHGSTPKEHIDMKILGEQRKWQEERLEKDRQWRTDEARKAEDRHRETLDQAKAIHWRELAIFGGVVTAALIIAQIIAAFISRPPAG